MIRVDAAQRRARLVARHGLGTPFATVADAATALVGLHSSDPATVYLAARARIAGFRVEDLEQALYEDRTLVRMLGMRRTLFVAPRDLAAVMQAACTRSYVATQRRRLVGLIEDQEWAGDAAWLAGLERDTLAALLDRGEATAVELTEDVPDLGTKVFYRGGSYGISTRVLFLLATAGKIVRARPRGTWISTQYRWAPLESWLGEPLEDLDPDRAACDLARRWLGAFGPGTGTDLKWWTGWTLGRTRAVLDEIGVVEVSLDGGGTGHLLPDDLEPVAAPEPRAALLPGLDPTVMGWKERDWYLGEHAPPLFDRNGNAGPTIWWDGAVVGGWAQREDGEIALGLLADVGREAESAIRDEAGRVEAWLGEMRVTPRFRTPLEKELRGQ